MSTIVPTSMLGPGKRTVTKTTLTSSDTFVFLTKKNPILVLDNDTGGPLTVTIDGAAGSTVPVAGIGDVNVSSGFSTGVIADGAQLAIPLNSIRAFLAGTITVTGGTGIKAALLHF